MATLLDVQHAKPYMLLPDHLVGRGPKCQLRLDNRLVSSLHARVHWAKNRWEIHDLDSRNGTFVNGHRLARGEHMTIGAGTTLAFGYLDEPFTLVDDCEPVAHATNQRGERREAEDHMFVLPDPSRPAYTVFEEHGTWFVEDVTSGKRQPARDGDVLAMDGDMFTLHLPAVSDSTWGSQRIPLRLCDITLRFSIEPTGERTGVTLVHRAYQIELAPRAHMEMLLRLAEARLADQREARNSSDQQGWLEVSELLKRLGIRAHDDKETAPRNMLDQQVYQVRKQFRNAGVLDAMDIVQRRVRFGTENRRPVGEIRIGMEKLLFFHTDGDSK